MNPLARIALSSALLVGSAVAKPLAHTPGRSNAERSPFRQTTICTTDADCGQGICSQSLEVGPAQHDQGCSASEGACHVTFTVSCPDIGCEAESSGVVCCHDTSAISATCNGTTYRAKPGNTWDAVREGDCASVDYRCN